MKTNQLIENQRQSVALTATDAAWCLPPDNLKLEINEAHVWLARIDGETAEFERLISADERVRAERFRFATDKKRFIAARALLRIILAEYLQTNPRRIEFEYNKFGKPFLKRNLQSSIKFNLSHSDDTALFAVADGREIGVDIERIKPSFADEGMLSQCLTARETVCFKNLPNDERDSFFFNCWTRKEAYLKACGSGLSLPANQIETSSFSQSPTVFFENDTEFRRRGWSLQKLPSIQGCAAALVIEGSSPPLKFWLQSNTASVQ